jgi:hypothetical protein
MQRIARKARSEEEGGGGVAVWLTWSWAVATREIVFVMTADVMATDDSCASSSSSTTNRQHTPSVRPHPRRTNGSASSVCIPMQLTSLARLCDPVAAAVEGGLRCVRAGVAWGCVPATVRGTPAATARPASERSHLRKTAFLSHLYIKTNILPRQARDKHRENSKKDAFSAPNPTVVAETKQK